MRGRVIPMVLVLTLAMAFLASPWWSSTASAQVSSTTSISAGFNSQAIPSGDVIWFSAVIQWVGNSPTILTHVHFIHQTLTFTAPNGTTWSRPVFSDLVTYDPSATTAKTVWNATAFRWDTTVPASYKGDVFLSGYAYFVGSGGVPGGTHVKWSGEFQSSGNCLQFNWKWAAAVYTQFTHQYGNIGVKPVDDNKLSVYQNSDHAGTPENFKTYLTAGGTGGGGSNFTGSYSGTVGTKVGSCP